MRCWDDGRGIDNGRSLGVWQKGTLYGFDALNDYVWNISTTLYGDANAGVEVGVDQYNTSNYPNSLLTGAALGTRDPLPGGTTNGMSYSGTTRPRNVALLACIKY